MMIDDSTPQLTGLSPSSLSGPVAAARLKYDEICIYLRFRSLQWVRLLSFSHVTKAGRVSRYDTNPCCSSTPMLPK